MIMTDVNDGTIQEMGQIVNEGVTSFKMFMAYPGVLFVDDGQIFRGMQRAGELGALICMHAENGIPIDVLVQQALAKGHTAPIYHALTRPQIAEAEGTFRAICLAEMAGAPVYMVHLSAERALEAGDRGARSRAARLRRDVPAVPLPLAGRPARAPTSRARSTCARRRSGPRTCKRTCGAACARTTSRSSRPTTARSA